MNWRESISLMGFLVVALTCLAAAPPLALSASPLAPTVLDFGAVPDDGQDDSAAFKAALESVPRNGLVLVPMGTYTLDSRVVLENKRLTGLGLPVLECRMDDVCIQIAGWQGGDRGQDLFGSRLEHFRILGNPGLDRVIWVSVGDYGHIEDVYVQGNGGDCLVAEPMREWAWIENLRVQDVKCEHIDRHGFVVRLPAKGKNNFVNETIWSNIETRNIKGHAFFIENLSNKGGGDSKISKLQIEYSELSAVGQETPDIMRVHTQNRGLVEFLLLHWVTVEDTSAKRPGVCLSLEPGGGKARINNVRIDGSICYGAKKGGIANGGATNIEVKSSAGF